MRVVSLNDDKTAWGVNSAQNIYFTTNAVSGNWITIPGGLIQISSVSLGGGAGYVCGVNSGDGIWCANYNSASAASLSWQNIPGGLMHVHVNADSSLWGVNRGN